MATGVVRGKPLLRPRTAPPISQLRRIRTCYLSVIDIRAFTLAVAVAPTGRPTSLLDFDEVGRLLRLGTFVEVGQQEIPTDRVIGSVGRAHEFDGAFRPHSARLRRLLEQIQSARPDAADLPITVYQVDHGYFVLDGHKRMALALTEGRLYIDAQVTRYLTRYHVDPATTMEAVRSTDEERRFREITGLAAGVPHARFPLSDLDGYLDLSESVKSHAYDVSVQRGQLVPAAEAAAHWYEFVFRPAAEAAREAGYDRLLATLTDADRFLVMRHGNRAAFGRNWEMPTAGMDRSLQNLRAATPSLVSSAASRISRRRRRPPGLLSEEEKGHSSE
jgi:hypothetical protein